MDEMKFCQSCGMPLEKSEVLGTDSDGTLSEDYCVYCYKEGKFIDDLTMDEMIAISLTHMKEMYQNDPAFDEQEALENMKEFFPKLKRWNKV